VPLSSPPLPHNDAFFIEIHDTLIATKQLLLSYGHDIQNNNKNNNNNASSFTPTADLQASTGHSFPVLGRGLLEKAFRDPMIHHWKLVALEEELDNKEDEEGENTNNFSCSLPTSRTRGG